MNDEQKARIENLLGELLDVLADIGDDFNIPWADSNGDVWEVHIEKIKN